MSFDLETISLLIRLPIYAILSVCLISSYNNIKYLVSERILHYKQLKDGETKERCTPEQWDLIKSVHKDVWRGVANTNMMFQICETAALSRVKSHHKKVSKVISDFFYGNVPEKITEDLLSILDNEHEEIRKIITEKFLDPHMGLKQND